MGGMTINVLIDRKSDNEVQAASGVSNLRWISSRHLKLHQDQSLLNKHLLLHLIPQLPSKILVVALSPNQESIEDPVITGTKQLELLHLRRLVKDVRINLINMSATGRTFYDC